VKENIEKALIYLNQIRGTVEQHTVFEHSDLGSECASEMPKRHK
jgi:hypothetical protein